MTYRNELDAKKYTIVAIVDHFDITHTNFLEIKKKHKTLCTLAYTAEDALTQCKVYLESKGESYTIESVYPMPQHLESSFNNYRIPTQ